MGPSPGVARYSGMLRHVTGCLDCPEELVRVTLVEGWMALPRELAEKSARVECCGCGKVLKPAWTIPEYEGGVFVRWIAA